MTLQPWEQIARELGDYDIEDTGSAYSSYRDLVRVKNEHYVGDWVKAETAAQEILRLRARLDALVAALQTGRALADWFFESHEVYDKRHPKWKNARCADDIAWAFREQADAAIAAARQEPARGAAEGGDGPSS